LKNYNITYGITGNYYATSNDKNELVTVCNQIGKSISSIRWSVKHNTWAIRVKSKKHKKALKSLK
jgi:flagellar biosynthesis/type III secretory pathway chaperone